MFVSSVCLYFPAMPVGFPSILGGASSVPRGGGGMVRMYLQGVGSGEVMKSKGS